MPSEFVRAQELAKEIDNAPSEQRLRLYGLLQQATHGQNTAPIPPTSEVVSRARWEAWKRVGIMTMDEAKGQYVKLVLQLAGRRRAEEFNAETEALIASGQGGDDQTEEDKAATEQINLDFLKAVDAARRATMEPEQRMRMYALHKQATAGPCDEESPAPNDIMGTARWNAWSALGQMPREEARIEYIKLVKTVNPSLAVESYEDEEAEEEQPEPEES